MEKNTEITRGEALELNAILGKSQIRSVGSDLFLSVIKIKGALSSVSKESQELLSEAFKALGITEGKRISPDSVIYKEALEIQKKIHEENIKVPDLKMLTSEKLQAFSEENPKLTASELEFIYKWMVKD